MFAIVGFFFILTLFESIMYILSLLQHLQFACFQISSLTNNKYPAELYFFVFK